MIYVIDILTPFNKIIVYLSRLSISIILKEEDHVPLSIVSLIYIFIFLI